MYYVIGTFMPSLHRESNNKPGFSLQHVYSGTPLTDTPELRTPARGENIMLQNQRIMLCRKRIAILPISPTCTFSDAGVLFR